MWRAKRVRGLKALHAPSKTWETISAGKNTGERESSDEAGSVLSAFRPVSSSPRKGRLRPMIFQPQVSRRHREERHSP